jgi:hypothetical protein
MGEFIDISNRWVGIINPKPPGRTPCDRNCRIFFAWPD